MPTYSHPDKLLVDHLANVRKIGLETFYSKKKLKFSIPEIDLEIALSVMLETHDAGKASTYFQEYLQAKIDEKEYTFSDKLKSHALISALIVLYKLDKQLGKTDYKNRLLLVAFAATYKHHGNLKNIKDMLNDVFNFEEILLKQLKEMSLEFKAFGFTIEKGFNLVDKLLEDKNLKNDPQLYYLLNFFFSILIYADKNEAIFSKNFIRESLLNKENLVDNYKKIKFSNKKKNSLNDMREGIYTLSEEQILYNKNSSIFSLNVPTGSGKTLSVINTGLKLLQNNSNIKRIIYALPFTSIIDQTASILEDIFLISNYDVKEFLLTHHHLSEAIISKENEDYHGKDAQFLIENWDKPFILTTFWQIFYTLISGKNQQLRKFHNFSNSLIILDEIQTLPFKYWLLVREILSSLSESLNCKIILLTATMPIIFEKDIPLIKEPIKSSYFSLFNRYSISLIQNLHNIDMDELLELAINDIKATKKDYLFVFNTIKSSLKFYKTLKEDLEEDNLIYLSTNILPVDRKMRIDKIKNTSKRKIIVSTQLIEAGVDIDLDIVYRDLAPFDSIVQSAGRCNRNNTKEKGLVKIFSLKDVHKNRSDHNMIYDQNSLRPTKDLLLRYPVIEEKDVLTISREYFLAVRKILSDELSHKIINSINDLNYDKLQQEFKLMDDSPSTLLFIEKDEIATATLDRLYNIFSMSEKWDKKSEFLKIKRQFYSYCLSVRNYSENGYHIADFEDIGGFKILRKNELDTYYDVEIGFRITSQLVF